MSINFPSSVQLNGRNIQAHIKPLGENVSQAKAKSFLDSNKDGYDTIGFKMDGKDFLLLTRQSDQLQAGDQLKIDGKRVNIEFVENEKTEFTPGARIGAALGGTVVGSVMMFLPTVITHSLIEDGANTMMIFGDAAKGLAKKALAKKVAIGMVAVGAVAGAAMMVKVANSSVLMPNEAITNSLTD